MEHDDEMYVMLQVFPEIIFLYPPGNEDIPTLGKGKTSSKMTWKGLGLC